MSVRVLDVSTREILFSDFLKLKLADEDLERFGASLLDEGVESSIAIVLGDKVGRKILDTVFPLMVVDVSGENVTLGQGGSQIKRGDRYELFMYGEWLLDPYTKEHIGRQETKIGTIEITRVNPKMTMAKVVESSVDLGAVFEPNKLICRASTEVTDKDAERKARREERDKKRKEKDKDW